MVDTLRLSYCCLEAQMLLDPISCGRMAFGLRVTCRHMRENQSILMGEGWGGRSGLAWWRHWHLSWVSWIRLQKWRTSPIKHIFCCCFSGAKPGAILWTPLWVEERGLPCPPLLPGVCSDSCPLSLWRYLTISSSATPFSFCLQSYPVWESFKYNQMSNSLKPWIIMYDCGTRIF